MNKFNLIKILALSLILISTLGSLCSWAQSPSKSNILEEYRLHQIDSLVEISNVLINKGDKRGRITHIDRAYKYNIRYVSRPVYTAHGGDPYQSKEYYLNLNSRSRSYRIHVINDIVKLYSENLSFFVEYDLQKGEATLKVKICDGSLGQEWKFDGYTYSYNGKLGDPIESWIIKDVVSRSNSTQKIL